jgi:hypothetical protein
LTALFSIARPATSSPHGCHGWCAGDHRGRWLARQVLVPRLRHDLGHGIAHTIFSEYLKLPDIQHPTDHRYLLNHG